MCKDFFPSFWSTILRCRSAALVASLAVSELIACGGTPASPTGPELECSDALARLSSCIADHCQTTQDPLCEVLSANRSNALFVRETARCDRMGATELQRLSTASCTELISDARLLASGKADFPCPAYFPWCNELAPANAYFHVNVLSSDASGATLEVLVGEVDRKTIYKNDRVYQSLALEGAGTTTEPGRPAVPTISLLVGVPKAIDSVVVQAQDRQDVWEVKDITLAPRARDRVEDSAPEPFEVDESFYGQDLEYPSADAVVDKVSTWRNHRVVRVTVHPFQYNPARKHLSAARRLVLKLSFLDTVGEKDDTVATGEQANAGAYGSALVNYPETAGKVPSQDDPTRTRYLFIVHDPLLEAVQPLVALKEQQGLHTEVVKLSEIGAAPDKIKARISKAYADSSIEYVLLVGSVQDLPMYTYELPETSFYPDGDIPGDHWYSLLAGEDLLPEVSVGRMTGSPEEVALHVAKTVAYETGDPSAAWRRKVLLVAHEELYPQKYTACTEEVRTRTYAAGPVDFTKVYGGEHATENQLVSEINSGFGIVGYRGHGLASSWMGWNGTDFSVGNADLQNGSRTPVVFSVACLNLAMQQGGVSHGEQWVRHAGGGGVGFLGATMRSWTPPNDLFLKQIFRGMLDEGVTTVMPLINRARAEMLRKFGPDDSGPDNAMMYVWLGDPSLKVGEGFQKQADVRVGWCKTQGPSELLTGAGTRTAPVAGRVWASGITESIGQGRDVQAAVGFGPVGTSPSGQEWAWTEATYAQDSGNNDEYQAALTPTAPGTYSFAMRFKGGHDADWIYCDLDGSQNGLEGSLLGVLTVE